MSVCVACLVVDVKMLSVNTGGLLHSYRQIIGSQETIPFDASHKLCWECAALVNKFNAFRLKCERAHTLLQDTYMMHGEITKQSVRGINRDSYKLSSTLSTQSIEIHNYVEAVPFVDEKSCFRTPEDVKEENCDLFDDLPLSHHATKVDNKVKAGDIIDDKNFIEVETNFKNESLIDESIASPEYSFQIDDVNLYSEPNYDFLIDDMKSKSDKKSSKKGAKIKKKVKSKVKNKIKSKEKEDKRKDSKKEHKISKKITDEEQDVDEEISEFATVLTLTQEQQIEEVMKRRESKNYKEGLYKCDLCFKGFVHEDAFTSHMKRHDPAMGDYECAICRVRWETERKLKRHIHAAHSTKYLCKLCPVISRNSLQARIHNKWHTGLIYKCDICGEEFKKKASYNSHCRIKHPCEDVCVICGNSFVSKLGLKQHMSQQHQNAKPTVDKTAYCEECDIHFASLQALEKHMEVSPKHAAGKKKSRKVCRDCGVKFASFDDMHRHRKERHPDIKYRVYKPRRRATAQSKPIAVKSTDEGAGPRCATCSRSFATHEAWVKHILISPAHKHETHLCPNGCKTCGKTFSDSESLAQHRKSEHKRACNLKKKECAEPFACEQCGEMMASYQAYNVHFRRLHPDKTRTHYPAMKDPVMCEVCGKVFKCQALLKIHNYRHTGERPYKCNVCNKSYNSPTVLHFHKVIHTNKTPFKCEICGQGFSKYSNLYRHRSVHTDATPYSCDMCGKRFKYKSTAKQHVEYVHMKKPWPKRDRSKKSLAQEPLLGDQAYVDS